MTHTLTLVAPTDGTALWKSMHTVSLSISPVSCVANINIFDEHHLLLARTNRHMGGFTDTINSTRCSGNAGAECRMQRGR